MFDKHVNKINANNDLVCCTGVKNSNKYTNHYKMVCAVVPTEQNTIVSFSPVSSTNSSKRKNSI